MKGTWTEQNNIDLIAYLDVHEVPAGLGSAESACSIAAINLAKSGELSDDIPDCMSLVLGNATITLQDAMPHEIRNSQRYKDLIPNMAGTGRDREAERAAVLIDWMWSTVLPQLQPIADDGGFGEQWQTMCRERTKEAAADAACATYATYAAADAADAATYAATYAFDAAVYAADAVVYAAVYAAHAAACVAFWQSVDPIGALERATFLEVK